MGFKENLKSELAYSGMLVKELAAKSGVNKYSLDNYLNARGQVPSVEVGIKIAQALGVSVEYLVTGMETKKGVRYPIEARKIAEITAQMSEKNRKIAVAIIKSMKKHEEEEEKREKNHK